MAKRLTQGRKPRRYDDEHKEDLLRWLLTYADMITLLLLFFILLYTISSLNIGKYKEIASAISSVFNGANFGLLFDRSNVGSADLSSPSPNQPAQSPQLRNQRLLFNQTISNLNVLIRQNLVTVTSNQQGVTISLAADALFRSGSASVEQQYYPVLQKVAEFLNGIPNQVRVEGFADNTPVAGTKFTSNWELAAARAINVLQAFEDYGVAPNRMAVVSYGDTKPFMSNSTAEGRAYNRRVDVQILVPPP